jgi:hypothetical protein
MQPPRADKPPPSLPTQPYLISLVKNDTYERSAQLLAEADLPAQLGISCPTLRGVPLDLEGFFSLRPNRSSMTKTLTCLEGTWRPPPINPYHKESD